MPLSAEHQKRLQTPETWEWASSNVRGERMHGWRMAKDRDEAFDRAGQFSHAFVRNKTSSEEVWICWCGSYWSKTEEEAVKRGPSLKEGIAKPHWKWRRLDSVDELFNLSDRLKELGDEVDEQNSPPHLSMITADQLKSLIAMVEWGMHSMPHGVDSRRVRADAICAIKFIEGCVRPRNGEPKRKPEKVAVGVTEDRHHARLAYRAERRY